MSQEEHKAGSELTFATAEKTKYRGHILFCPQTARERTACCLEKPLVTAVQKTDCKSEICSNARAAFFFFSSLS